MNLVDVFNGTRVPVDPGAVGRLAGVVLQQEGVGGAEVSIEFVGERRIRTLNAEHRGRDQVTDVLSFPLEDADEKPVLMMNGDEAPPRLLGDVVVCARQALRQARADDLPPAFEVSLLIVHGLLHLLGHDHESDAQAQVMERLEAEILGELGIDPFADRAE